MRPVGQSNFESIDQSMAVNDIYIDSIQAKLNILEKLWEKTMSE